jgi:hypothetical protein
VTNVISEPTTVTTIVDSLTTDVTITATVTEMPTVLQTVAIATQIQKRRAHGSKQQEQDKQDPKARALASTCSPLIVMSSSFPTYASACSSFAKYSLACSCNGVQGATSTVQPTATSIVTQTVTTTPTTVLTNTQTATQPVTLNQTSEIPLTATQTTIITETLTATATLDLPTTEIIPVTTTVTCSSYGFHAQATSGPYAGLFVGGASFNVGTKEGTLSFSTNPNYMQTFTVTGDHKVLWTTVPGEVWSADTSTLALTPLYLDPDGTNGRVFLLCTFGGSPTGHPIGAIDCTPGPIGLHYKFLVCPGYSQSRGLDVHTVWYGDPVQAAGRGCAESDLIAIPVCL